MRNRQFKIRMTEAEIDQLHKLAADHRVSAADLVRAQLLGPDACHRLPDHATLREILRQLKGMAGNLNQSVKLANQANARGELSVNQFKGIYDALVASKQHWQSLDQQISDQLGLVQSKQRKDADD